MIMMVVMLDVAVRNLVDGKLSYRDFVWFLISEEDKRHPRRLVVKYHCVSTCCIVLITSRSGLQVGKRSVEPCPFPYPVPFTLSLPSLPLPPYFFLPSLSGGHLPQIHSS